MDLSELHLSYFFFNSPTDPLGNTAKDTVSLPTTASNYLESGGNNLFTMFELASWTGAAPEALAPYENSSSIPSLNSALAYEDTAHLQNARFVSTADLDNVKKLIMEYGAVSSAFYYDSRYLSDSSGYYYPRVASYNNHIVTLVGWDDNYAAYHFKEGSRPSSPGAWIAKNSHGISFGDGGYFYISYEDKTLNNRKDALSYAFDLEKADNYDHNYQYDGSFGASTLDLDNGECLANIFTVSGNPGGREQLKAVSFALYTPDVYYSIQVYKNPDPGEPESGPGHVFFQAIWPHHLQRLLHDSTENPACLQGSRYFLRSPHLPWKKSDQRGHLCGLYLQHSRHPVPFLRHRRGRAFIKAAEPGKI